MTLGIRILMLGEDKLMVTLEGPEHGLFQELSRLLRQKGKEMVRRLTSVVIYIWLDYICFRFAVLVGSPWQLLYGSDKTNKEIHWSRLR